MELNSPSEFAKQKVLAVQEYTLLSIHSLANLFRKPRYLADMVQQADLIGVGSLPIVVLIGFFTGAVLAVQTANTMQRFGSITLIGQLVALSLVRELGPVLPGLLVAGRAEGGLQLGGVGHREARSVQDPDPVAEPAVGGGGGAACGLVPCIRGDGKLCSRENGDRYKSNHSGQVFSCAP